MDFSVTGHSLEGNHENLCKSVHCAVLVAADVDAEGEDGEEQHGHHQAQHPHEGPVGFTGGGGVQGPGY